MVAVPCVAALLRIVLVQCHGGIENERTFSGIKYSKMMPRIRSEERRVGKEISVRTSAMIAV